MRTAEAECIALELRDPDPRKNIDITGGRGTWNVDMDSGPTEESDMDKRIAAYHNARDSKQGVDD